MAKVVKRMLSNLYARLFLPASVMNAPGSNYLSSSTGNYARGDFSTMRDTNTRAKLRRQKRLRKRR